MTKYKKDDIVKMKGIANQCVFIPFIFVKFVENQKYRQQGVFKVEYIKEAKIEYIATPKFPWDEFDIKNHVLDIENKKQFYIGKCDIIQDNMLDIMRKKVGKIAI